MNDPRLFRDIYPPGRYAASSRTLCPMTYFFSCSTRPFVPRRARTHRTGAGSSFATPPSSGSSASGRSKGGPATRPATARRKEIAALPRNQRLSLNSVRDLAHGLDTVPVIVAVSGHEGPPFDAGGSTFPAVQNFQLAARALGLGSYIFNLPMRDQLYEMLGIPENNQLYCLLPLGYPTDRHGPLNRKPVNAVVFDEKYGANWAFAEEQPERGWEDRWVKDG